MDEPSLSMELKVLFTAITNSTNILYRNHSEYFKLALLGLIAFLAFKIGRATVTDPLDVEVKQMSQALTNRNHYTIYLPKKIKEITKLRKYILASILLLALPGGILYWLKHDLVVKRSVQETMIAGIAGGVASLAVVFFWLYEKFLGLMIRRGGFNDHLLHEKLTKIIDSFGKKT